MLKTPSNSVLSTNMFSYCENNPVVYSDITGQWCGIDDLFAGLVGAIVGVVSQFVSDVIASAILSKVLPIKVSGITSGRNSMGAVFTSGLTKLSKGTASKMSMKVVGKGIVANFVSDLSCTVGMGVKNSKDNFREPYQRQKEANQIGPLYWCVP